MLLDKGYAGEVLVLLGKGHAGEVLVLPMVRVLVLLVYR